MGTFSAAHSHHLSYGEVPLSPPPPPPRVKKKAASLIQYVFNMVSDLNLLVSWSFLVISYLRN